jgi:hypothetical protein
MDLKHIKKLLEIANKDLPKVEGIYRNLDREVENLNLKKRDAEATILKLNNDIIHLRNTGAYQSVECGKQESEKRNLSLKKTRFIIVAITTSIIGISLVSAIVKVNFTMVIS